MANQFGVLTGDVSQPALDMFPITPHNSDLLDPPARVFQCRGDAGTVTYVTLRGNERQITIAAGEIIRCQIKQVKATGTTATGLWGYE